jgi:hypothetical protein
VRPEAEYSDEDGEKIHRESVISNDRNTREQTQEDTEGLAEPQRREEHKHEESPNSLGAELVEFGSNGEAALGEKLENGLEFSGHQRQNDHSEPSHDTLETSAAQFTTESFVPEVATQELSVSIPFSEETPAVVHQEHTHPHEH